MTLTEYITRTKEDILGAWDDGAFKETLVELDKSEIEVLDHNLNIIENPRDLAYEIRIPALHKHFQTTYIIKPNRPSLYLFTRIGTQSVFKLKEPFNPKEYAIKPQYYPVRIA